MTDNPKSEPWAEDLNLSDKARLMIHEELDLFSLLYDLDLLPEQLLSQQEKTPGLVKAYHRLYGVLYAFQALRGEFPDVRSRVQVEHERHDLERLQVLLDRISQAEPRSTALQNAFRDFNVAAGDYVQERLRSWRVDHAAQS